MTPWTLTGLAVADFRDRVRRGSYAVTLLAAVGLGYLAVPAAGGHWVIMDVGGYRGVYTSAWVGTVTALAGGLWLTLGGFYLVRNAIDRDERTRVGQLLAATPLRTAGYLAGKFLSNVLVLGSMAAVLAVTALVMQLARGESYRVDPIALLLPFVVLTLPLLILTAGLAVVFETVPVLRGGGGNIVWFFLAMAAALGGESPTAPLGGIGVSAVAGSMRAALAAAHIDVRGHEFSLGLTYVDHPLRTFRWDGFTPGGALIGGRLLFVGIAVALALLPALWFGRFDPARGRYRAAAAVGPTYRPAVVDLTRRVVLPRTAPVRGGAADRLFTGELLLLLRGVSVWWWIGAGIATVAGLAAPSGVSASLMLPACWIWPVLLWSRLGTRPVIHDVAGILGAYPAARRRQVAEWAAGAVLTAATGLGPAVRMAIAADGAGLAHWAAAVVLIPAAALVLGTLSHTQRLFQALYLPAWYLIVNGIGAVDFMGALREAGRPVGPSPVGVAALGVVLLGGALAVGTLRHARR